MTSNACFIPTSPGPGIHSSQWFPALVTGVFVGVNSPSTVTAPVFRLLGKTPPDWPEISKGPGIRQQVNSVFLPVIFIKSPSDFTWKLFTFTAVFEVFRQDTRPDPAFPLGYPFLVTVT
jgi:hypothetical protein